MRDIAEKLKNKKYASAYQSLGVTETQTNKSKAKNYAKLIASHNASYIK